MIDQDIQRRMDAYRGNPQALMQRYQQNQQLIDLLALQKLKSEKEAAARSLQMAAAQGQGEPPTVAQQREQEVMGLTQQEVARSVGAEAQQRAAREQEAMQRLLQGIAGAPGAENAMPERAMAAGGIVAFQSGGYNDMIRRQQAEKGSIYSREFGLPPEERAILQDPELVKQLVDQMTLPELQEFNRSGRRAIPERLKGVQLQPRAPAEERPTPGTMAPELEATAPPVEAPREPVDFPPQPYRGPMRDSAAPTQETPPTLTPAPAPTAAPTPASEGIAAALPQLQRPGAPGLQNALEQEVLRGLTRDPMEMARLRQSMIPGLNPERMAARQKGLAELEKTYAEENDPKRRLLRDLTAFFLGGAGRSSNAAALAGGAQGYLQSTEAQQAAQRARMKELEAAREGIRALEEGRELEVGKAGLTGLTAADEARRAALTAGSGMTSSERAAAAGMYGAELQAQVSRENAAAQRTQRAIEIAGREAENALRREGLDVTRYVEMKRDRERLAGDLFKSLKTDPKNFKLTDAQIEASVNARLRDFDTILSQLGKKAGLGAPAGAAPGVNLPSADAIQAELRRREVR